MCIRDRRRGGQCYYELGSPLSSHASSTVPDGLQTGREPHRHLVGSRVESPPPDTWTESGQTPALREVSSSRERSALRPAVRRYHDRLPLGFHRRCLTWRSSSGPTTPGSVSYTHL